MFSKKSKYAIKALVKLAKEGKNSSMHIQEISDSEKIPKKFLELILINLKNAGYVSSKKGKGGGYSIAKNPEEINLAEIHRLFDGPIALLPCASYKYYEKCAECADENKCGIRKVVKIIRDKTVQVMKKTTIAEILKREK